MNSAVKSVRIAVTIPPAGFFGGLDRRAAFVLLDELERKFGSSFFKVDTTPFFFRNIRGQAAVVEQLIDFRPDLAISLSNAGYGLACRTGDEGKNVFTELLGIPLMLLWDHGLFQFPSVVLNPPDNPAESSGDAVRRVRDVISHPLIYHYPIDTGQVAEMRRIGLLEGRNVFPMPALAYDPFAIAGETSYERTYEQDLTFVGNVYLSDRYQAKLERNPEAAALHRQIVEQSELSTPAWLRLAAVIDGLSAEVRQATRLDYDQSFFWWFASALIGHGCTTQQRIDLLRAIDRPIAFYGSFADPEGVPILRDLVSRLNFKGSVDFATGLPSVYQKSKILVDVTNAAFISNCSTKPINCFAAGGFALFDRKSDAVAALGPDAEAVMYRDQEDLSRKIDHFLTHDAEREALADHLRETIATKLRYGQAVYDSCVALMDETFPSPRTSAREWCRLWSARPEGLTQPLKEFELSSVRVSPEWHGAKRLSVAPLRIQTCSQPWGYSAKVSFSSADFRRANGRKLWLEVSGKVLTGRIGIGLLDKAGTFADEQFAEANDEGFQLVFSLDPAVAARLIVRSSEIPSSIVEITRVAIVCEVGETPRQLAEGDEVARSGVFGFMAKALKRLRP